MMTAAPAVLPGPRPLPVAGWRGNVFQFMRDPVAYLRNAHREHGDIVGFVRGGSGWIFTFHPTYTRQLLTDQDLFYSNPFIAAPPDTALARVTTGLLSMNGAHHRQQRKLVLPAFHKRYVESYRDDMVAVTQRILDRWRPGQRLNMALEMQRLTLCIASKTLFGLDAEGEAEQFGRQIKRWLRLHESPLNFLFPYDLPASPYRRLLRASENLEAIFRLMLDQKRTAPPADRDVLGMLLQARDEQGVGLTDAELIGQASILFIAGHETTSNALTWTLFLLAQHPHILTDLLDELAGVLGGAAPTVEQIGQLPLLDRVIKESMRVLPPVCYSYRVSTAPFMLGPYQLAKGTGLFFSQYITHHAPELYPDPEHFWPDRWLTIDPSPYEYLPFGAGPRMCIGATFAIMELKIVLAMVLQRYRLTIVPGAWIARQLKITLSPKYGMPVDVAPQDRAFKASPVRGNIHEMVRLG